MRAYSSVSGGVIFVPDEVETKKSAAVSYDDLAKKAKPTRMSIGAMLFGRRKSTAKKLLKAA